MAAFQSGEMLLSTSLHMPFVPPMDPCVRMVALTSDALAALSGMEEGCEVRALLLLKQAAALEKQVAGDRWQVKAGLHTALAEAYTWIGDAKDLEQAQAKSRESLAGASDYGESGSATDAEIDTVGCIGNYELNADAEISTVNCSGIAAEWREGTHTSIKEEPGGESNFQDPVSTVDEHGQQGSSSQAFNTRAFGSFKAGKRTKSYVHNRSADCGSGPRVYRGSLDSGMAMSGQEGAPSGSWQKRGTCLVAPYQKARWWYEKAKQELAMAYQLHAEASHSEPRASLMILVRTGDLFGRLRQDESAAACYVAAAAQSKKLSSAEEAREIKEEILHAARGLKTRCGRAVLASFTDSEQNPAGLKARALLCMREGRYKEAEVTYLRLLELMRDQKLADADTLLLAKGCQRNARCCWPPGGVRTRRRMVRQKRFRLHFRCVGVTTTFWCFDRWITKLEDRWCSWDWSRSLVRSLEGKRFQRKERPTGGTSDAASYFEGPQLAAVPSCD